MSREKVRRQKFRALCQFGNGKATKSHDCKNVIILIIKYAGSLGTWLPALPLSALVEGVSPTGYGRHFMTFSIFTYPEPT